MLLGNGIADHSNMIYMTCGVQQKLWPKPLILLEVACIDTDDQVSKNGNHHTFLPFKSEIHS